MGNAENVILIKDAKLHISPNCETIAVMTEADMVLHFNRGMSWKIDLRRHDQSFDIGDFLPSYRLLPLPRWLP